MSEVPRVVRDEVQAELWRQADALVWESLGLSEKSRQYELWTNSPAIGGRLGAHIDPRTVRVYIKDTLLKGYSRHKLQEHEAAVFRVVGQPSDTIPRRFIKPHGALFSDGALVHWGRADDWKVIVTSLFERGDDVAASSMAMVLFRAQPRFSSSAERRVVEDVAKRLGIIRCVWFD